MQTETFEQDTKINLIQKYLSSLQQWYLYFTVQHI